MTIAVVGAGLSGATIARELAVRGYKSEVFEARNHEAGNCHCTRDKETGIQYHVYGPHVFHTDSEKVWKYVQKFADFVPYTQRTKAVVHGRVFSFPINLHTINQFFDCTMTPTQARFYIDSKVLRLGHEPRNFEEQALSMIGPELYEGFIRGYTIKQWGRHPTDLPASILKRLPLRFTYDDNYFNHPYQGIPRYGYTQMVQAMLDHPNITVHLDARFVRGDDAKYVHTYYTGPLDAWFAHGYGRLAYRTLDFKVERHMNVDAQGVAVMNYCDRDVPYTRRVDFKHFTPWETQAHSFVYEEHSREAEPGDEPYYPVRLVKDKEVLAQYEEAARGERDVTFVGRLARYQYLDMHRAIGAALELFP